MYNVYGDREEFHVGSHGKRSSHPTFLFRFCIEDISCQTSMCTFDALALYLILFIFIAHRFHRHNAYIRMYRKLLFTYTIKCISEILLDSVFDTEYSSL